MSGDEETRDNPMEDSSPNFPFQVIYALCNSLVHGDVRLSIPYPNTRRLARRHTESSQGQT